MTDAKVKCVAMPLAACPHCHGAGEDELGMCLTCRGSGGNGRYEDETRHILSRSYTPEGVNVWMVARRHLSPAERRIEALAVEGAHLDPDDPEMRKAVLAGLRAADRGDVVPATDVRADLDRIIEKGGDHDG